MEKNPFSLVFGKEPGCVVNRSVQSEEMVEDFLSENPCNQVYIITGVRGQGKTVMLTSLEKRFQKEKDWIVIDLNPERDLLQAFAANLYEHPQLKTAFVKADLNLSVLGIGVAVRNEPPVLDVEVALRKMLDIVKKHKKRVLIAIDEASNTQNMRILVSSFQILVRSDYPVFLLMTGLFENVRSLQDEKSLTFLYCAPRMELKPLGISAMTSQYQKAFDINENEATKLAVFTKGYPFAFQVVGYLKYQNRCELEDLIPDFDIQMEEKVYEKIWSELSGKDREIVTVLAKNGKMKTQEIIDATGNTSSTYSIYRKRLHDKGIVEIKEYGFAELALPRFAEFVRRYTMI